MPALHLEGAVLTTPLDGMKGRFMELVKTGSVLATLLCIAITPVGAQTLLSSDSPGTTAGLRIQLDQSGQRLQSSPSQTNDSRSGAAPRSTSHVPVVVTSPVAPQLLRAGAVSPAGSQGPTKVVRLNGLFHASSRVQVGPGGKLVGDCEIDDHGTQEGNKNQ